MLSVSEGSMTVCEESPGETFVNRHGLMAVLFPFHR